MEEEDDDDFVGPLGHRLLSARRGFRLKLEPDALRREFNEW
jgi:hypothetical protein